MRDREYPIAERLGPFDSPAVAHHTAESQFSGANVFS
jgi:hypothetical protein